MPSTVFSPNKPMVERSRKPCHGPGSSLAWERMIDYEFRWRARFHEGLWRWRLGREPMRTATARALRVVLRSRLPGLHL
jgi:hypothetical protein